METLDALLKVMPAEKDREEVRRLAHQYREQREQREDPAAIVDQVMERIALGFRAVRHPLPTRQEVARMIEEAGAVGE
jgi:hypothetical protein